MNDAFLQLRGQTLARVEKSEADDELRFIAATGEVWIMAHEQDCCESVYIESITGDLGDLVGEEIVLAEMSEQDDPAPADGSGTWTFYKLATRKGYVDIRWYGSSNGYYSESVRVRRARAGS